MEMLFNLAAGNIYSKRNISVTSMQFVRWYNRMLRHSLLLFELCFYESIGFEIFLKLTAKIEIGCSFEIEFHSVRFLHTDINIVWHRMDFLCRISVDVGVANVISIVATPFYRFWSIKPTQSDTASLIFGDIDFMLRDFSCSLLAHFRVI